MQQRTLFFIQLVVTIKTKWLQILLTCVISLAFRDTFCLTYLLICLLIRRRDFKSVIF